MRTGLVVLALALLLAAMPSQAAPGTLALRAELPAELSGNHEARGSEAQVLLEGQGGQATLLLQGSEGTLTRVIHRAWGYVSTDSPKLEVVWDDRVERLDLPLDDALVSLNERRPEFRILAQSDDIAMASGPSGSPLLMGALSESKTVDHQLERAFSLRLNPPSDEDSFSHVFSAGTLQARANDGRVTADGDVGLFVSGAVVSYLRGAEQESLPAHFRIESVAGSIYNPLTKTWSGPSSHTEYVQEYLLIDASQAHLDMLFDGTPGSLFAKQTSVVLEGTALLPAATGVVSITEDGKTTRHALGGEALELAGRFTLRFHDVLSSPARSQVEGDGDFTTVSYAGTSAHYDWTRAAAAAGLGAILLAALGWALFHIKTLAPAAGGLIAGYARVSGQEILEHPGRAEVYERVKAYPGISFVELADQVGFGQSTLNYHLRVLEKNEYITPVKDGRYLRFFDRQAGTYAGPKKMAVSALRNTTSAAMARHIRANPGVPQRDLAAAFGVTPSTVSWHISRLSEAGLVTRERDAHFTRYYLSEGWAQLPAEEVERQSGASVQPPAGLLIAMA